MTSSLDTWNIPHSIFKSRVKLSARYIKRDTSIALVLFVRRRRMLFLRRPDDDTDGGSDGEASSTSPLFYGFSTRFRRLINFTSVRRYLWDDHVLSLIFPPTLSGDGNLPRSFSFSSRFPALSLFARPCSLDANILHKCTFTSKIVANCTLSRA